MDLTPIIPLIASLVDKLPAGSKPEGEIAKAHISLLVEQLRSAKEKLADRDKELAALRSDYDRLSHMVASAGLNDEYVQDGIFVLKKGDPNKRCPNCRAVLSSQARRHVCPSCGWQHDPGALPPATCSQAELAEYERRGWL